MSSEPVISLQDVSFAYEGVPVLEDVNLAVAERQLLCMVGPNGGGKTTLLKLILGLLRPGRGRVRVFGQPPQRVRLRMGYMPQYVRHDLKFPVTVLDIVLMGRLGRRGPAGWLGWYGPADRQSACEALGLVGMDTAAQRPFAALSGGQRQRVLLARALCCQPDLLLLDEPTANVDTLVETKLFEVLRRLNQHMTILVVSHDLGFVSNLVETVVCVNRRVLLHPTGRITPEAIEGLYGAEMRLVRHGETLAPQGPGHD